jgi:ribosomal-protein-alanine N-acetyltransferase
MNDGASGDPAISRVRAADARSVEHLAHLHNECFARGWSVDEISSLLLSPGVFAWQATDQRDVAGAAVGFILCRLVADEAEILTLAVRPAARRCGAGRGLVALALAELCGDGARSVFLEVAVGNVAACALYERHGFVGMSTRKGYYGDGADALTLRWTANAGL